MIRDPRDDDADIEYRDSETRERLERPTGPYELVSMGAYCTPVGYPDPCSGIIHWIRSCRTEDSEAEPT